MRLLGLVFCCALVVPAVARADIPLIAVDDVRAGLETIDLAAFRSGGGAEHKALTACLGNRRRTGLGLAFFDKKGMTTKVLVGGTGDARLDRCVEKAVKVRVWPAVEGGGVVTFRLIMVDDDLHAFAAIPAGFRRGSVTAHREGAVAVTLGISAARFGGDDVVTDELVADTVATGDFDLVGALNGRVDAVAACYSGKLGALAGSAGVALVVVDKAGKGKVTVGGSGVAKLDRCLGKAIARATWPTTSAGGVMIVSIHPSAAPTASASTDANREPPE